MEIKYFKNLLVNPILKKKRIRFEGMSITEIENLETQFNNGSPFPKSFREFLFIAGKYDHLIEYDKYDYAEMQEDARSRLDEFEVTIDKPFFVIDQLDGCEQFCFFYKDEGIEDPTIYNACPAYIDYSEPLIKTNFYKSFSKRMNALFNHSLKI